ncbi:MAG: YifB family Mg chelatase-like AAA ATPase [Selenomonadaceae bacterium]|nr:YifB family Mg chelatase-like AAA ATPase [Selenomonadaceae bacterium]
MYARTFGATTLGVDGMIITVEVDSSNGLPAFDIVGLPSGSVKEAKERVRTAIKNSGLYLKQERVTINLAPADIRKEGSTLDLPIAMGLLAAHGIVPIESMSKVLFAAELSLEGTLRGISGVLPMTIQAKKEGFEKIFVARENANEALLVDDIEVFAPENLAQVIAHLIGERKLSPAEKIESDESEADEFFNDDFADVQGQFLAKHALEIAAAGGHNVLMVGVPGSGKTMLARRVSTILPEMTKEEALEVTKIYSIAGLLKGGGLITRRPFCAPHHTSSTAALVGGGQFPRPGAVTLSHHGILFLDEFPEFGKASLEVLREPLEDRKVTISRVNATLTFPANVTLICAMNPCPCGWRGDHDHECTCTQKELKNYARKLSGPLLDRIDIHINVPRVKYEEISSTIKSEPSEKIRERVVKAREIQIKRLEPYKIFCNAQMTHSMIQELCPMNDQARDLLRETFMRDHISARSYDRIIKVARTIADLDGSEIINGDHIGEAVHLRSNLYSKA